MKFALKTVLAAALISISASAAVVATVNGNTITSEEVDSVLMEGTQGRFTTLPKDKQDELKKRVVDGMITQMLVYEDAKNTGVLESKVYKDKLKNVMAQFEKQLASEVWSKQQYNKIKVFE
jgi:hypothetical protein